MKSQIEIRVTYYRFLGHKSYINCAELKGFADEYLTDRRAPVNIVTKAEIRKVIGDSDIIGPGYPKLILHSSWLTPPTQPELLS